MLYLISIIVPYIFTYFHNHYSFTWVFPYNLPIFTYGKYNIWKNNPILDSILFFHIIIIYFHLSSHLPKSKSFQVAFHLRQAFFNGPPLAAIAHRLGRQRAGGRRDGARRKAAAGEGGSTWGAMGGTIGEP
jgi:hypothetical protein